MKRFFVRRSSRDLFFKATIEKTGGSYNWQLFVYFCADEMASPDEPYLPYLAIENSKDILTVRNKLKRKIFCIERSKFLDFQRFVDPKTLADAKNPSTGDSKAGADEKMVALDADSPEDYELGLANEEFQKGDAQTSKIRLESFPPEPGYVAPSTSPREVLLDVVRRQKLIARDEKLAKSRLDQHVFILGLAQCLRQLVQENNHRVVVQDSIFFSECLVPDIEEFLKGLVTTQGLDRYELIAAYHYVMLYTSLPATKVFITDYLHEFNLRNLFFVASLIAFKNWNDEGYYKDINVDFCGFLCGDLDANQKRVLQELHASEMEFILAIDFNVIMDLGQFTEYEKYFIAIGQGLESPTNLISRPHDQRVEDEVRRVLNPVLLPPLIECVIRQGLFAPEANRVMHDEKQLSVIRATLTEANTRANLKAKTKAAADEKAGDKLRSNVDDSDSEVTSSVPHTPVFK